VIVHTTEFVDQTKGNIASVNERSIMGRPISCTTGSRSSLIHFKIMWLNRPFWIDLCKKNRNQAKNYTTYKITYKHN
jgi:hypothetical protein